MENHLQYLPDLPEPFRMIAVQGGPFDMGGEGLSKSSLPVHQVEVDDFWIGQYPVTQVLWTDVMGEGNNPSYFKGATRPVETISWDKIDQEFLPRLNKKTENFRPPGTAYRLPTEAEWEYAARGGIYWQDKPFTFSGSNIIDEVGWYNGNSHDETKPVGLKLPNQLGICDMSGNVWEWCADWYDSEYYHKCLGEGLVKNPKGPEKGASRVDRGSGWLSRVQGCRTMCRNDDTPVRRSFNIGFRLVLSALPV